MKLSHSTPRNSVDMRQVRWPAFLVTRFQDSKQPGQTPGALFGIYRALGVSSYAWTAGWGIPEAGEGIWTEGPKVSGWHLDWVDSAWIEYWGRAGNRALEVPEGGGPVLSPVLPRGMPWPWRDL